MADMLGVETGDSGTVPAFNDALTDFWRQNGAAINYVFQGETTDESFLILEKLSAYFNSMAADRNYEGYDKYEADNGKVDQWFGMMRGRAGEYMQSVPELLARVVYDLEKDRLNGESEAMNKAKTDYKKMVLPALEAYLSEPGSSKGASR